MNFFAIDLFNIAKLFELYGEEGVRLAIQSVESGRCNEETIEKHLYSENETTSQFIERFCKETFGENYVVPNSPNEQEKLNADTTSFLRNLIMSDQKND